MYTLQYHLTDEDYLQYNIYHTFSTPVYRRSAQTYRYLFAAGYALLAVIWLFVFSLNRKAFTIVIMILCIGIACFYLFGTTYRIKWNLRRSMEKMKRVGKLPYDPDITVTFDDSTINSASADKETIAKYSTVERIILGEEALYIYTASTNAFLVPYRAFQTEQERQSFLTFLEAKTNVKAIQGQSR